MNYDEKRRFIVELVNAVEATILSKACIMPDEWDGIELRQYIADCFRHEAHFKMSRTRKTAYNNAILISNL